MKPIITILLIILQSNCLFGQKFGKVDKKDLAQIEHEEHQEAEVSYLVKNTKCYYKLNRSSYVMISEHFNRIKIHKKEGLDIADQTIYLYVSGKDAEKINGLKAEVFNIENGKVTKTKLDKKDIFKEKSEDYEIVKFALPNVQAGSVIDIKYKIISPFLYSFPKHYFQSKYPVEYSNYTVIIPEYFDMTPIATGFIPLDREESFSYTSGQQEAQFSFTASSVPPLKDDDYVLNINDYRSSLKYELDKISFPGQSTKNFSNNWASIGNNLLDNQYLGKQINSKINNAKAIVEEAKTMEEKDRIQFIYNHVQSHFSNNDEEGIYCNKTLKEAYEEGVGSSQEINLTLINLLKKSGIDAAPVLTRDRSSGILNVYYPSLTNLNRLFCLVNTSEGSLFLDASNKFYPLGSVRPKLNNISGILIEEGQSKPIDLNNTNYYSSARLTNYTIDLEEEILNGKGSLKLSNQAAIDFREEEESAINQEEVVDEEDSNEEDDEDEDEFEDATTYINILGLDDIYQPIKIDFSESKFSGIDFIDNEIFIDGFVNYEIEQNPFEKEERNFPAFFSKLPDYYNVSIIDIPSDCSITSVPSSTVINMPEGAGQFSYSATPNANKLIVKVKLKLDKGIYSPEEYIILRNFYQAIIDKQKEKIILEKV